MFKRIWLIWSTIAEASRIQANWFYLSTTVIPTDLPYTDVTLSATYNIINWDSSTFSWVWSTGAAIQFATTLTISQSGFYAFQLDFRDGARLKFGDINVQDTPILELDGIIDGTGENIRTSTPQYVEAGSYPVYLEYFTVKSGYSRLKFYYRGPDTGDEWALVCSGGASTCSPLDPPHKPEITVFGDNPSYFLKNASADYEDPGSQCLSGDEDSVNRWAWEVVLEKPSLGTTGTFYTNYTCEDSYGLIDTANREVIIRDVPSITLIGPTPFVLLKDDTFSDPQACCLDFAGNSLSVVSFQSVTSDEGVYETSYTCVDPLISYMVTANRQVVVNTEPVIELLGDSTVKITKGTGYVDDGIVCHDAEDGLITNIRPDNEEIIRPARVYTSDSSTATARAAVDGNGEDTCGNCELVQTGLLRWVQLDLGAPRSVTQVRLYAPSDGFQVQVGLLPWPIQGNSTLYESTTSDCSSVSKWDIWDLHLCERAAELLGLSFTSSSFSSATGDAHACVYDSSSTSLEIKLGDARSTYAATLSGATSAVSSATLSGTQTRICGPLAPFTQIEAGFCEDLGYQPIRTGVRCGLAAAALGFTMASHTATASVQAPGGCYRYSSDSSIRLNQDQGAKEYESSTASATLCQLPGSCIDYYISYSDDNMVTGTSATTQSTWGDCMESCASNADCGVWSFNQTSSSCKLFIAGAAGSASTDDDLISGPAFCQDVPGIPCREDLTASTGWSNATCKAPMVGRFVMIWTRKASGDMKLCEAEVRGGLAPKMPNTFYIPSGCTDAAVTGDYNFILNGNDRGWPLYQYPQEEIYELETGLEKASFTYDPTAQRWVLEIATGAVAHAYTAASLPEGALIMTAESGSSPSCRRPMVRADPATSCSWRFGFSQKSKRYECRDGTICSNDNEDCCSSNGGLYRCPYDLPVMCDTATDNLYTCAASVDECTSLALGGARTCQGLATDSTADGCFVSGVSGTTFSTVMTDGTLTESSAEDCQHRCRTTGGCAHFSYYPSSATDNCKLHDSLAVEGNESGTTSGPPTCLASVSTVNNADPDVIGFFRVYYQCTDSTGAQVGLSRLVEVGCEGPNPDGVYGGNIVTCDTVQTGPEKTADYLACLKICTANSVCETYEFYGGIYEDGGNCTTYSGCDGVYSEDTDSNRQVGYCQRINHYPKIYVTASARTMNLGDTSWVEGTVECTDYEDPYPPEPTTVTTFDRDVAGEYVFYYTCEDTIGQQTKGNRTVTVKDNCEAPSGVANAEDPPCEEGSGPFAHGTSCTTICQEGYMTSSSGSLLTCTTQSDSDYNSVWDNLANFVCGDQPCDAPAVSENLKDTDSCQEGTSIPSGGTCTPNCAEGNSPTYVPTASSLSCDKGVLTPTTYECHAVASAPIYVTYEERNVDSIVVAWSIGDTSDCVFQSWRLQYLLTNSYTGEAAWSEWIENDNCPNSTLTGASRTSVLQCEAQYLEEGSTYQFRVREECTNSDLNSDWTTSEEITTTILTPPAAIFYLPSTDVYDSPGSIMVAFDQAVIPGQPNRKVEVIKSGENCVHDDDKNYTQYPSQMQTTSLEGAAGMEIAGSRILIITPPATYWTGSCLYNVTFDEASIWPDTTGTKKNMTAFWYNFTYIEIPPELVSITRNDSSITSTSVGYSIQWDLRTQMNCTATPNDMTTCETDRDTTYALSPTASRRCEDRNSTNDMIQEEPTEPHYFTIEDLYPSLEYFVTCSGWIPGKFWVPTVAIPDSWSLQRTVTTSADTETGISSFLLTVYAECKDLSHHQIYQAYLRESEFELGYTAQIDDWIAACQPGVSLELEESVNFIYGATVVTVSENAYVQWEAGPNLTVTYTKPADATESAIITSYVKFTIQSLAWWTDPSDSNEQDFEVLATVVDIGFSWPNFTDSTVPYQMISGQNLLAPMHESTGVALPDGYEELVLDVGAEMYFQIKVSQTGFNWTEVSLHLMSVSSDSGFEVNAVYLEADGQIAKYYFQLTGQGTQLPFILLWRSAVFVIPLWISFSPPVISVVSLTAPITTTQDVEASFSNVPDSVDGRSFAEPAKFMQMYIIKFGYTQELCGATSFSGTWSSGKCTLDPGALEDVTIYLKIYNHQQGDFLLVPGDQAGGLAGVISYKQPSIKEMASDVLNALREGILDLGKIVNTFPAYIYITTGEIFPQVGNLKLQGGAVPGYKVELVSPSGSCDGVQLCQSITWINDTYLQCEVEPCLDITCLPREPNVKLYLGDLEGQTEMVGKINFPRPIIEKLDPTIINDVGLSRYVSFWGLYFSEPSCQASHLESIQFVSNDTSTQITVGEFAAACVISLHNSTYLQCMVTGAVRNVRDVADTSSLVPPALLEDTQTFTWTLCGIYVPLNEDSTGVYASEFDPETGSVWVTPTMVFTVSLLTCEDGYRRSSDYSYICIPCEKGHWITSSETEWPLRCWPCPIATYQDSEGSTGCSACPSFTTSPQGADDVTHCTCLPGYYSPYYDESTGETFPGTPCSACHDTDLMESLDTDESCGDGGYNVGDLCTARDEDLCVNMDTTSVAWKICKIYCPGGTAWPLAKRTFWHLMRSSAESVIEGYDAYKPKVQRCLPQVACLPGNVCNREYEGQACAECKFGWFMDASTGLCEECGEAQKIGMIIMAIFSVVGSFGCLVFFAFFMRFNADIVFKRDMLIAIQMYIVTPLKKSNFFAKAKRKSEARKAVTITRSQLGMSHSFSKYRELGMVFRVDESQIVHLAGLTKDSPLRGKVVPGWKVNTINGRRLKVRKEGEVQEIIQRSNFPLRLTFSAPLKSKEQEKQEADGKSVDGVNFEDDRKMVVVMLGVLTSFTKVSGFDFQWPDAFTELVKIAQMFSFNLNFFAPECSAETPYITKWIGYLVLPYFMIMPLTAAYLMACMATLPGLGPEAKQTKRQLLTNAWARCICMVLLALLPFHLDTILIPFACVSLGDGIYVLADVPSVKCSSADETFMTMFGAGSLAMLVFATGFSWLIYCIWCSYQWQQGTRDRSNIPFYVAMVEVSTFGQRGYTAEVRTRVMENVCAVRAFDVSATKLHEREAKMRAREMLKGRDHREKRFAPEKEEKFIDKSGELGQDGLQQRLAITKAKKRFLKKNTWPSKADGNLVTYGWIFLVNTLLRNLLSNAAIKLTSQNLVVIGAGLQMLIFALNVTMLVCLSPYKSRFVVKTESVLMGVLFMILWCAVMKELLERHTDRHLYEDMVETVNTIITAFAFTLMFFVPFVPMYFVYQVIKKAGQLVTGPDAVLNEIYMTAHQKKMKRRKEAEMAALNKLVEKEVDTDERREMLANVGLVMPQLETTLARFEEAGLGKYVLPEVQKKYMLRLGKLAGKINEERVLAIEAERSREDADQAAANLAALQGQNASEEELEIARLEVEAAEVTAIKAQTRLTLSRKSRLTQMNVPALKR